MISQSAWFNTELGTWWLKQVQRVTWILNGETPSTHYERAVAERHHNALQEFKNKVLYVWPTGDSYASHDRA